MLCGSLCEAVWEVVREAGGVVRKVVRRWCGAGGRVVVWEGGGGVGGRGGGVGGRGGGSDSRVAKAERAPSSHLCVRSEGGSVDQRAAQGQ